MQSKPPCAGVLVFRNHRDGTQIILVQARGGTWGFPKGKRERGESVEQNALRELTEETSLVREQISPLPGVTIDELSAKGNLSVRYFIARLIDPSAELQAPPDESQVCWKTVEDALTLLPKHRRVTLRRACTILGID